ncbi:universal stress protein [Embleya sp. NBC_00896]|uniref:universal stress protein n=1 Tax=Embleya sp. NBC_00896 TaxID=2975961 RepID=UPI00386E1B26|nr:universal stress protein [Embleya sp. NBC_00896]
MNHASPSAGSSPRPTLPLGHVIVGVDGSPAAEVAADLAADEALRRHTTLEVLHVLEWVELGGGKDRFGQQLRENAHAIADAAAERARLRHPDLKVVATVELADVVDALAAASDRAALLVVGSRGLGGFAGLLMGSVGLPIAAVVRCPLLVVHPEHRPAPERTPGPIVVGVSGTDCAPALEAAFAQALARSVPVHAVHAWRHPAMVSAGAPFAPAPWVVQDWQGLAETTLDAAVAPLREKYPDVAVTEAVVLDAAAHALIAASADADLVVLAAHRRTARFGPNLGRTTHTVLHHAKAPILLVPVGTRAPHQG